MKMKFHWNGIDQRAIEIFMYFSDVSLKHAQDELRQFPRWVLEGEDRAFHR